MKYIILRLSLLFLSLTAVSMDCCAQTGQDTLAFKKEFLEQQYQQYKSELALFEKLHGHWIQTPNVKMHYLTWGSPSGIPLIWSHGTFGNAYEMYPIADSLVAKGIFLIAIDYYGHGLTPFPQKQVSLYHVADDLKFLMDKLGIKKAIMGGFSRGGSITTAFYDAYPDRVSALILEDGGSVAWDVNDHKLTLDSITKKYNQQYSSRGKSTTYNAELEMFNRIYVRHYKRPDFKSFVFHVFNAFKLDSDGKYRFNAGIENFVGQATAEQLITAITRPSASNTLFAASTHLLHPEIIYRNLSVPMLILDPISDNDWFDFRMQNELLAKEHPSFITHHIYENTGHAIKSEKPQQYINDIGTFLKLVQTEK